MRSDFFGIWHPSSLLADFEIWFFEPSTVVNLSDPTPILRPLLEPVFFEFIALFKSPIAHECGSSSCSPREGGVMMPVI